MPSSSQMIERREREFAQFLDPDYKWLISNVNRVDDETIELVLNDLSTATVMRSIDYFEPPKICRNGMYFFIPPSSYNPAYTSVQYLMILLFGREPTSH
jgi:hypothetical protein